MILRPNNNFQYENLQRNESFFLAGYFGIFGIEENQNMFLIEPTFSYIMYCRYLLQQEEQIN